MIHHLRIRNFKTWRDTGNLRLAPLTLLFGTNSAGKTSIPQLLLLLRQTLESADRKRVLHLGDKTTLIDLGTFEDILFQHNREHALEFEIGWEAAQPVVVEDPESKMEVSASNLSFKASIQADRSWQPFVNAFSYSLGNDELVAGMKRRATGAKYDLDTENYKAVRQQGRAWPLPAPYHFHGFPDEAIAYFKNTAFLSDLVLRLQELMKSIYHVGPLREHPSRTYLWSGEQHQHVGQRGERAVEALLAAQNRKFNWKPRQRNVATTANGSNEGAPPRCVAESALALQHVMQACHVYVDDAGEILAEYRSNLRASGQPGPGDAFLKWLLTHEWGQARVTRVEITRKAADVEDYAELPAPEDSTVYDPSDRKFLAVAVASPKRPQILQSFDCKWWGWQAALAKVGVTICFLCPEAIEAKYREKMRP